MWGDGLLDSPLRLTLIDHEFFELMGLPAQVYSF